MSLRQQRLRRRRQQRHRQQTAAPLEKITVRTPFKFNAYDMAYSMGVARGFCEENGLDVTIEFGAGSGAVIQTVASRQDDFAGVDGGVAMQAISNEDVPVKYLAVHLQKGADGLHHPAGNALGGSFLVRGERSRYGEQPWIRRAHASAGHPRAVRIGLWKTSICSSWTSNRAFRCGWSRGTRESSRASPRVTSSGRGLKCLMPSTTPMPTTTSRRTASVWSPTRP